MIEKPTNIRGGGIAKHTVLPQEQEKPAELKVKTYNFSRTSPPLSGRNIEQLSKNPLEAQVSNKIATNIPSSRQKH